MRFPELSDVRKWFSSCGRGTLKVDSISTSLAFKLAFITALIALIWIAQKQANDYGEMVNGEPSPEDSYTAWTDWMLQQFQCFDLLPNFEYPDVPYVPTAEDLREMNQTLSDFFGNRTLAEYLEEDYGMTVDEFNGLVEEAARIDKAEAAAELAQQNCEDANWRKAIYFMAFGITGHAYFMLSCFCGGAYKTARNAWNLWKEHRISVARHNQEEEAELDLLTVEL